MKLVLLSIIGMGGLGFFFASILAAANEKFKVKEDPKIIEIEGALPGVNCGACGFLNCHDYAAHVANGSASVDSCRPGGESTKQALAKIMGVEAKQGVKVKAIVHCAADKKDRKRKAYYIGAMTCAGANIVKGGEVLCGYGCLGYGDCMAACPFDAIRMIDGLPRIILDKCVACGKCVEACPRDIISLAELDRNGKALYVACRSHEKGALTRKICSKGCIACGICARLSGGAFEIKDFLAEPDRAKLKNVENRAEIMLKCPTKVIKQVGS